MDKEDEEVKEAKDEDKDELKEFDAPSFERKNSPAGDSLKDLAPKKVGTIYCTGRKRRRIIRRRN